MHSRKPNTLQAVVRDALDGRRDSHWPVSIADTVLRVRAQMPDCDLTDGELADLIAIAALERRLSEIQRGKVTRRLG